MRISDWSSDVCSSDLFDFVNPNAPKGGTLILSANGTFDTFNPFNAKGTAAASAGIATATLMVNGDDEAFTMYGLQIGRAASRAHVCQCASISVVDGTVKKKTKTTNTIAKYNDV